MSQDLRDPVAPPGGASLPAPPPAPTAGALPLVPGAPTPRQRNGAAFPTPGAVRDEAAAVVAMRSERMFRVFGSYIRLTLPRQFRAVRLSGTMPAAIPRDRPVVVFSNHPSWWDPLLFMLLADRCFRGRPGFGPMDAAALERYGVFKRLGIFGIDLNSAAGARRFLRVSRAVLAHQGGAGGRAMLWVTAEGAFTDPRQRPLRLRPGIGHLAALSSEILMLPMAIEYVFWNESRPEILVRFGEPIPGGTAGEGRAPRPSDWTARLEGALEATMDRLAQDARARDPARFTRLLGGRSGVGGIYDLYRAAGARLRGERFRRSHEAED
ncbi:lysophospholipid acyltransferase family protein [Rhizosaccharibacter radicis]|uniref:Lysophospholipid acyltransferase family protein n=1 Tax=Rhizosaccharibacter radicis TaxID=2782605 RepID=A0ABT1W273_9PROT|nr:lysophospholipid acyltransferase family protein [Acetobacteraceae bacterium KSS12]